MLKRLLASAVVALVVWAFSVESSADLNLELLGTVEGEHVGDRFGDAVAGLGDVNGDGYEDFAVGARWYDTNGTDYHRGKVYVYFGGAAFDNSPDLTLEGKQSQDWFYRVIGVGDINRDDFADFAVSSPRDPGPGYVYIYFGGENVDTIPDVILTGTTKHNNLDLFGYRMAAGDLNQDGEIDVMVVSDDMGHCSVYSGDVRADTAPDYVLTKNNHYYGFQGIVTGDMNGDLYDELIVGSGQLFESYLYFGGESLHTEPDLIFDQTGDLVTADFNGDEYTDLANPTGVHYGSATLDTMVDLRIGYVPHAAGHVNKDRFADLITRGDDYSTLGSVHIYLGGAAMDSVRDWAKVGGYGGSFGRAIATADINNDGVDEVIIGEPGYFFGDNRGRVYVYSGDTTPVSVEEEQPEQTHPFSFTLKQNFPNPFNSNTTISYSLSVSRPTRVVVTIHNILGQEVRELVNSVQVSGDHRATWNGKDDQANEVTSGIYLCQLKVGEQSSSRKLLLLK
jgi:hypothetical protein